MPFEESDADYLLYVFEKILGKLDSRCQGYNFCMIHILQSQPTSEQMADMLRQYDSMIKIVVDVRRRILAGGGEMHADCEEVLLDNGSEQDDLWGANWYPDDQHIEFESLINIRPRLGNRSILIQSEELCQKVEGVAREIFGGLA